MTTNRIVSQRHADAGRKGEKKTVSRRDKKLSQLLADIVCHSHDAEGGLITEYGSMSLDDWKKVLSDLEIVHYLCQDARTIVRRRIREANLSGKRVKESS